MLLDCEKAQHLSPASRAWDLAGRDPRVIPMYRDSLTRGYLLSPLRGSLTQTSGLSLLASSLDQSDRALNSNFGSRLFIDRH